MLTSFKSFASVRSKFPLTILVLLASFCVTVFVLALLVIIFVERAQQTFYQESNQVAVRLQEQLLANEDILYHVQSLFAASEVVSREEFNVYISSLRLERRFPGISAISYVEAVSADKVSELEELVRNDTSLTDTGYPDFSVRPIDQGKELYYQIIYIEPYEGRESALGFDISSEAHRQAALERAINTNDIAITSPVDFVTGVKGVFMVLPTGTVSPAGNKQFVLLSIRVNDFFEKFISSLGNQSYNDFAVYQKVAGEEYFMYATDGYDEALKWNFLSASNNANGHKVKFTLHSRESNFDQLFKALPALISTLVAGLLISLLVAWSTYLILNSRSKAVAYADEVTKELRLQQERLTTFNNIVTLPQLDITERINKMLEMATKELGLEMGIVSIISYQKYEVEYVYHDSGIEVEKGQTFELKNTFCSETLNRNLITAITHVSASEYKTHPAYEKTKLESYIGIPLIVNEQRYGTLNFSSRKPRENDYTFEDIQFVQLVALWLARTLEDKAADSAKTEFVSMASHQLRTPLTAIGWNTELLLNEYQSNLNSEQKDLLKDVEEGTKRMIELVNNLLNISRIELGTFSIEPRPSDLVRLAKSVLKELQVSVKEKDLEIVTDFDKVPLINADPGLLRIVFQNLLSNAVKYTPADGKIELSVKEKGEHLTVTVKDNGYGVPEKEKGSLFKKFYRANNVQKKSIEGTGLGLYIVKSILDTADGNISFTSVEGEGTIFVVTLPKTGMRSRTGTRSLSD